MYKISYLKYADYAQRRIGNGCMIPVRPANEDYRSFRQRVKEAWAVFTGKASAFTWD